MERDNERMREMASKGKGEFANSQLFFKINNLSSAFGEEKPQS